MPEGDYHTADTDAIRDVAQTEFYAIAEDLEAARMQFLRMESEATEALKHVDVTVFGTTVGVYAPFARIKERWDRAADAITGGLARSEMRIQDAAEALLQIAENYDADQAQTEAEMHELSRSLYDN